MGTKITIGNRTTAIPNVYGQIKSGIVNPPAAIDFGNVVIIDDGSFGSTNYIAVNGVNGTNKQGLDSFLEFTEYAQTTSVIWDSELLTLIKSLFKPTRRQGSLGANKVIYIQASTTEPASVTFPFAKGDLVLQTIPEGVSLNGALIGKTYNTLAFPETVVATPSASGGTLAAGTYYYKVTALNASGETVGSAQVSAITTGATGSVALTWGAVTGATSYKIYKGTISGTYTGYFTSGIASYTDTGSAVTAGSIPTAPTNLSMELANGFAIKLENGRAYGFSLGFYRGVHTKMEDPLNPGYGFNEQPLPDVYEGVSAGVYNINKPNLLFRSPDFRTLSELKKWLDRSPDFKKWFSVTSFVFTPTDDAVTSADISNNQTAMTPYKLFAGGTTVFNAQDFTDALALTAGVDNTFYLALKSGDDATGIENSAIFDLLSSGDLKFEKYMFVPGYTDSSNFLGSLDTSEAISSYYNNQHVIVTHGLAKITNSIYPSGFRNISVLEKTAKLLGRTAGLAPQTPLTFKDIAIDAEVHKLSESDKEAAIEAGILCTSYDNELSAFTVLAGINTLGNNDFLVNESDASSYDIGVERIKAQLVKEIVYNAKRTFFGDDEGPNRSTVTTEDLKTWTYGFLKSKLGTLIVRIGEITVRVEQDNYFVDFEVVPNYPVSKIVFTGIILNA
jgi:hypothetical protein